MKLLEFFDRYARDYRPYKGGNWCYEDGCLYRGLECLHRATGEERWFDHLMRLITPQILEGPRLAGYDQSEYNIDNILSGRALLYLHDVTGREAYLDAALTLAEQLATHPRTGSGVYWHKLRYPWQIWLDGLYMGPPFQVALAKRTGNSAMLVDAVAQVGKALDATHVPVTNLYAHAMDEARKQPWANRTTGQSDAHWARSLGWLAMGLVDLADLAGPDRFASLKPRTGQLLDDLAALRRPDGLWWQVIDQPDLPGNYEESSASAMIVYALLKGHELGLFEGSIAGLADTLTQRVLRPKEQGAWEMIEICEVAGLGMFEGRFRDGSAAYYVSERRVADDIKGVGPLMMAVATHAATRAPQPAVGS